MHIHRTIQSFRIVRKAIDESLSVGFVPTMGALHEGHLSIMRKAREENDVVVASIFVNPTQFIAGEDFDKYPRSLERDTELLKNCGVDHLFAPDNQIMYGTNHQTFVDVHGFDDIPEGRCRPGHFRGVATIVTKLFNIVQPSNAYFGQKDAAQCVLIKRIVQDLDMNVRVHIMPTKREEDGLAMSSRNAYLQQNERKAASIIYKSLQAAKGVYEAAFAGGFPIASIILHDVVKNTLEGDPMVSDIQYISIDCKENMKPLSVVNESGAIISVACKLGNVRLIDNIVL